jgi:serine/threonine protein kinase
MIRLGAGGMGTVYLGRAGHGRLAAVKVVHQHLASDTEFRARFAREIAVARSVDAPWTARVLDADPTGTRPWLATEYVDGPSLDDHVATSGPMPEIAVARLCSMLAAAPADLHARGVVHRDLKPANVLLTADGVRLIDFGIARAVDATRITSTGLRIGTPAYMSPEQVAGQEPGAASDVFSLGSVLTFAATGSGPFGTSSNPVALLVGISRDAPDLGGVPARVRPAIAACLGREPAARPPATEVTRWFTGQATAGPPPTLVEPRIGPPPARTASPGRQRNPTRMLDAVVLAMVALAALAGVVTWMVGTYL